MRELFSRGRRRWLLPVLEAEALSTEALAGQLQACLDALVRIERRLDTLELDVAAEAEVLAEQLVATRRRHEELASVVDELQQV